MRSMSLAVAAVSLVAVAAAHAEPPGKMSNGRLVDNAGMTLYVFDKDVAGSGKSACNGPCAALWPPAAAPADAKPEGAFTTIVRDDGSRQWAYKGKPVYTYKEDKKAGDMGGDNFKDSWHVVK